MLEFGNLVHKEGSVRARSRSVTLSQLGKNGEQIPASRLIGAQVIPAGLPAAVPPPTERNVLAGEWAAGFEGLKSAVWDQVGARRPWPFVPLLGDRLALRLPHLCTARGGISDGHALRPE